MSAFDENPVTTEDETTGKALPNLKKTKTEPNEDSVSEPEPKEIGGRDGPDPTRYGDWEKGGRCIDF